MSETKQTSTGKNGIRRRYSKNKSPLQQLPRYPLCLILSHLAETDGTSALITNKHFYYRLLPIFILPPHLIPLTSRHKYRHEFKPFPVQDPQTLLDRLNTRRLKKRRRYDHHHHHHSNGYNHAFYPENLTINEMTKIESSQNNNNHHHPPPYPPTLPLLRLTPLTLPSQTTLLASYPRSGNTLLRTLLERLTLTVTGSDTRPDRTLSRLLAHQHDLIGEGVTSPLSIIKSHWPERRGCHEFEIRKVLLVVRNPMDAICSYFQMMATNTHCEAVTEEVFERYRDMFEDMALCEVEVWRKFHEFWWEGMVSETDGSYGGGDKKAAIAARKVALLVIRYEDLVRYAREVIMVIMPFILGRGRWEMEREYWMMRIDYVVGEGSVGDWGSYKPRAGGGGIGKSWWRYSEELKRQMAERAGDGFFAQWGYDEMTTMDMEEVGERLQPLPGFGVMREGQGGAVFTVNRGAELRSKDDPYGRNMTSWRRSQTEDDTKPFPRINKKIS